MRRQLSSSSLAILYSCDCIDYCSCVPIIMLMLMLCPGLFSSHPLFGQTPNAALSLLFLSSNNYRLLLAASQLEPTLISLLVACSSRKSINTSAISFSQHSPVIHSPFDLKTTFQPILLLWLWLLSFSSTLSTRN